MIVEWIIAGITWTGDGWDAKWFRMTPTYSTLEICEQERLERPLFREDTEGTITFCMKHGEDFNINPSDHTKDKSGNLGKKRD